MARSLLVCSLAESLLRSGRAERQKSATGSRVRELVLRYENGHGTFNECEVQCTHFDRAA